MTSGELIALAKAKASELQLSPELVCAIVEQESSWNPWAMRYEPAFFAKYVSLLYTNNKISASEAYARGFSWGLGQVMGQVAREFGFEGQFLSELCEPSIGLQIMCKVLAQKLAAAEGNVERALLLYNGGRNPRYPAEVLARQDKYR
jgi:soluble lytic murein transglycosylase-like protein